MGINNTAALDMSIFRKGFPATAGSKSLAGFTAPFDATAVTRLAARGASFVHPEETAEFGIDGLSEDASHDGSACRETRGVLKAVCENRADYALVNDVFGIYRREAPKCGCYCIRPTYGTVSRYGLIPTASSMDQIGVVCKSISAGFGTLSVIAGCDENDGAMFPDREYGYKPVESPVSVLTPETLLDAAVDGDAEAIRGFAGNFKRGNINLEYFNLYKQVMYVLCAAEFSSNVSRYDGIKFGYRAEGYRDVNDLYVKSRAESFGPEVKLAVIIGTMALSQGRYAAHYEKAMKLRRLIRDSVKLGNDEVIALPTRIKGGKYENLALFSLACLAGLPSVSFSYRGCGMQLIAGERNENALFSACKAVESLRREGNDNEV